MGRLLLLSFITIVACGASLGSMESSQQQAYDQRQRGIGLIPARGKPGDLKQSLKYLKAAASLGDVEAQWMLGTWYSKPEMVEKNYAKARGYFLQCAALRYKSCATYVALVEAAEIVDAHQIEAARTPATYARFFTYLNADAVKRGEDGDQAKYVLALFYMEGGPGLPKDVTKAMQLLGAVNHYPKAYRELARLYVGRDNVKSEAYRRRAAAEEAADLAAGKDPDA